MVIFGVPSGGTKPGVVENEGNFSREPLTWVRLTFWDSVKWRRLMSFLVACDWSSNFCFLFYCFGLMGWSGIS